jgi:hypothetical protein
MDTTQTNKGTAAMNIATMTTYAERVRQLEQEGMTTSDAQAVADAEDLIPVSATPTPRRPQRTNMWTNVNATNPLFKARGY